VPHFDGRPLASRPILLDGNARPHNLYSARLSVTGGNRATTLVCHVTGYESDRIFMGLSRTKSERTYPKVSKHSGIRDCFGSGMATVPSTQTETLDSWNEETCSGTVQDVRRLYLLKCCISLSPYADTAINWIQQETTFIRLVHSLPRPDIPSHMVTCPLKHGCFVAYCQ
jgi:hypothetical protein